MFVLPFFIIPLVVRGISSQRATTNEYEQNIYFNFYQNNKLVLRTNTLRDNLTNACDNNNGDDQWLILVPGWTQNCSTTWVTVAIESICIRRKKVIKIYTHGEFTEFHQFRGGCIGCMDYYYYSYEWTLTGYLRLRSQFDRISNVLLAALQEFQRQNFTPERGHMFSMSFGSQLAINAGRDFGGQLASIDACEPAGPLFFPNAEYQKRGPSSLAAQNVQVIHTSCDEGTLQRDAHQDWLMGDCGINQAAANNSLSLPQFQMPAITVEPVYVPFSRENHDMCPLFYLSAFENIFEAVHNPCCLFSDRDAVPAPLDYRMGYMQADKGKVQYKTLHAYTFKDSPYNGLDVRSTPLPGNETNSIS